MRIAVGSDHAAIELRQHLVALLTSLGHTVTEAGPATGESVDYPDIARPIAQA